MRVLVTGSDGYIGAVMAPWLEAEGHDVIGVDAMFFEDCGFGDRPARGSRRVDVRDLEASDLAGVDAIVHLAALSNDPLGNLDPQLTAEINQRPSFRLARLAKDAGVSRFLFSSSCSLYGASDDELQTEEAEFRPLTPYAVSKVEVEADLRALADDAFSPVFLRNATVYGVSPKLRTDLVVNNLVGWAVTTGEVLIQSDGSPWRPLVHVEDVCRVFAAALVAPRELVHNEAFNVGRNEDNLQVRDIATIVEEVVPGSRVTYAPGASADNRCYRVDAGKLLRVLPAAAPQWTVREGVESVYRAYVAHGFTLDDLQEKYVRLRRIRQLMDSDTLDGSLRWNAREGVAAGGGE